MFLLYHSHEEGNDYILPKGWMYRDEGWKEDPRIPKGWIYKDEVWKRLYSLPEEWRLRPAPEGRSPVDATTAHISSSQANVMFVNICWREHTSCQAILE